MQPFKNISLLALVTLFAFLVLVAAKPAPEVLFHDIYSGAGELSDHVADSGHHYLCNDDGRARVGGGQATFFGGGTFSEPDRGAHQCVLVDINGTPIVFTGGVFEFTVRVFQSDAPGTSRSLFVGVKFGDFSQLGITLDGFGDTPLVQGALEDGTHWSVPLAVRNNTGILRVSADPKSGDVFVEWQSDPQGLFVKITEGSIDPNFTVTVMGGGGGSTFINPDGAMLDLVITEWVKPKKEKKPKKDKDKKSK